VKPWKFILSIAVLLLVAGYLLRGKQLMSADDVLTPNEEPIAWKADLEGTLPNELSALPRMDHAIDSFLNFWGLHGASLAIVRNDSLLFARGYGWADSDTRMNPDIRLRMASVSKLLTAVGIMRLQEEGKVFLETPVFGPFGILKEYDSCIKDDHYYQITVEHLLRHQGGFSTRGGDVMFNTARFMQQHGIKEPPTTDYLVRKELARRLAFEPGTYQEYSNFGYLLLSLVIERASGMSYEEFMQKEVFEPAGCRHFALGGDYLKDRLPGETRYYMHPDAEPSPSFDGKYAAIDKCYGGNYISGLYGAGGWIGSTVELARLVCSIDGHGPVPDILEPFSVAQMTHYFDENTYGLGWVDCKPDGEWTRTGSFSGTSALIKVYPDGECWIMITNTSAWRGSRFTRNTAALFRNLRSRFSSQLPTRDMFRN
jgi:CubicO group peptidase (beta-lactamase class C family)